MKKVLTIVLCIVVALAVAGAVSAFLSGCFGSKDEICDCCSDFAD